MSTLKQWAHGPAAVLMLFGIMDGCFFSAGMPPPLADGEGGTDPTGSGGAGGDGSGGGGSGGAAIVLVPVLGMQIDRMGRPLTNLMLNHTFEPNLLVKDAAKEMWNSAPIDQWTAFIPEIAFNLGILDGFDADCGDQYLADLTAGADRYVMLAAILADDRVWVRLDVVGCNYLGIETGAMDCGGRPITSDVINKSYTLLMSGGLPPVNDGISPDPVKTSGTAFPYLAEPQ